MHHTCRSLPYPSSVLEVLHLPGPLPSPSSTIAGLASLTASYCSLEVSLA